MTEPEWIDETDVLAIHERALAEHGGAPGLRDENLLLSALARPRQLHTYNEAADMIEMAVAFIAGIVRNHPFVDGNKRTGFVAGILFLELNGVRFTAPEAEATKAMLDLASGALNEGGFATWLRSYTVLSY
ncbi:MAG TPA: type II toxin-antitoxin system death-on-curing family toxin [Candidatus Binataceae bacterium]|jgi:death-on-curing protein|nr:type II toxin-antitoxin system death-on-curing family toxin [Candidatus Binataceae bacterium]